MRRRRSTCPSAALAGALAAAAETALANAAACRTAREAADNAFARGQADLAAREREAAQAHSAQAAWDGTWRAAVRALLDALATLPGDLGARAEMAQRIAAMERDQTALRERVAALFAALGEDPPDAPRAGAQRLTQRLAAAQEDARRKSDRQNDLERLGAERDRLEIAQAERAASLLAETQAPSLDAARAALAGIDIDTTARQASDLDDQIALGETRARDLFADQARAQEALARVDRDEEAARSWLRLRAGALIAGRALRDWRETRRSAMMTRASHAFALITRGAYAGLTTRGDAERETLIALSAEGGSKLVGDLSKGALPILSGAASGRLRGVRAGARSRAVRRRRHSRNLRRAALGGSLPAVRAHGCDRAGDLSHPSPPSLRHRPPRRARRAGA